MYRNRPAPRFGLRFGLVGMALVLAAFAIGFSLIRSSLPYPGPRDVLGETTTELQSIIVRARNSALAGGHPVAVLFYPHFASDSQRRGRIVVYEDACQDFFTRALACGVSYASYDPATLPQGHVGTLRSKVLETMDLPADIIVEGTAGGTLPGPFSDIGANVGCSFCGTCGGAVRFDSDGHLKFYSLSDGVVAGPLAVRSGGSLVLGVEARSVSDIATERALRRALIILSSGAVMTMNAR